MFVRVCRAFHVWLDRVEDRVFYVLDHVLNGGDSWRAYEKGKR